MRAAFRTPGFTRLYAGLTASMLGDSLMLIVLSMWVKKLTDSNAAAGLTFLWLTIPALLAPLLGYVVDRVPRRAFLVAVNLGSAVAMMPLLLVRDASDVWIIYTVAFVYGVSFVVVPAALNGLLKRVPRGDAARPAVPATAGRADHGRPTRDDHPGRGDPGCPDPGGRARAARRTPGLPGHQGTLNVAPAGDRPSIGGSRTTRMSGARWGMMRR